MPVRTRVEGVEGVRRQLGPSNALLRVRQREDAGPGLRHKLAANVRENRVVLPGLAPTRSYTQHPLTRHTSLQHRQENSLYSSRCEAPVNPRLCFPTLRLTCVLSTSESSSPFSLSRESR